MDREAVNIAISVMSVIISYFLARHFGDVAGTKAAIAFEKEKASKARIAALRALLNEIEVIRGLAQQNSEINPTESSQTIVLKMPVTTFETAFLSSESNLLDDWGAGLQRLLVSVKAYLARAHAINTLRDYYLASVGQLSSSMSGLWRKDAANGVKEESCNLLKTLNQLEELLTQELKGKTRTGS